MLLCRRIVGGGVMCMSVLAGVAGLSDHYQAKAEEGLLEGLGE